MTTGVPQGPDQGGFEQWRIRHMVRRTLVTTYLIAVIGLIMAGCPGFLPPRLVSLAILGEDSIPYNGLRRYKVDGRFSDGLTRDWIQGSTVFTIEGSYGRLGDFTEDGTALHNTNDTASDQTITLKAWAAPDGSYQEASMTITLRGSPPAAADSDADGVPDDSDGCPDDPNKTSPGACGCGSQETPGCEQVG